MKALAAYVSVSLFFSSMTYAQAPATKEALTHRLEAIAAAYTAESPEAPFSGTVLVTLADRPLLDRGYGLANRDWNIPNTPEVKFRLGSLTKQFTAVLILLLQQDGKLSISDPVSKYLPDSPKAWETITIANLLGHTSGIPDFLDDPAFGVWAMSPHSPAEELAFFRDRPLQFQPGWFSYSNSNYEVLGDVIEKVSGQSYSEMLRTRIFEPLGMKGSGLDTDSLILPQRAEGYTQSRSGVVRAKSISMSVPWAAGSIYSTTGDLLLWERGLFGGTLLNEASLKAMNRPGEGDYGLGVMVKQRNGVTVVFHNGSVSGFNTFLAYIPERKATVTVLCNMNGGAARLMGAELVDELLAEPIP